MSRNFFEDLLNLDSLIYNLKGLFLGGTWEKPGGQKNANAINLLTPAQRGGQAPIPMPQRPGQAPQQPGAAGPVPQRPGAPGQPPPRPGAPSQVPQRPGMPGVPPQGQAPQRPGAVPQSAPVEPSTPPTRAEQNMQLLRARGMGYFRETLDRWIAQLQTQIRAYFERKS